MFEKLIANRFNNCFDGLIRSIDISYKTDANTPLIAISIETQDNESDTGWSILEITLQKVYSYKLSQTRSSWQILSDGLMIKRIDGKLGLFFDSDFHIENVFEVTSDFYVIGDELTFQVNDLT